MTNLDGYFHVGCVLNLLGFYMHKIAYFTHVMMILSCTYSVLLQNILIHSNLKTDFKH